MDVLRTILNDAKLPRFEEKALACLELAPLNPSAIARRELLAASQVFATIALVSVLGDPDTGTPIGASLRWLAETHAQKP